MRRPLLFSATTPYLAGIRGCLSPRFDGGSFLIKHHQSRGHDQPISRATVAFLGRLDPIKRPWASRCERFPHVEFIFMGQSHFRESVRGTM